MSSRKSKRPRMPRQGPATNLRPAGPHVQVDRDEALDEEWEPNYTDDPAVTMYQDGVEPAIMNEPWGESLADDD
jgi:hypothetical protein